MGVDLQKDPTFFDRADKFIVLANEHCSEVGRGKVSASFLYGCARFQAWNAACWAADAASMCPFSIHAIEREPLAFPGGSKSFRWHIPINWPHGSLRFEAAGFRLTLVGTPVVHSRQSLSPEQRTRAA